MHVDGWLCEIKDVQIRDGLHVLGQAPGGHRADQPGAGHPAVQPGLRRPGQRRAGAPHRARAGRGCPPTGTRSTRVEAQARDAGRRSSPTAGWRDRSRSTSVVDEIIGVPNATSPLRLQLRLPRGGAAAGRHAQTRSPPPCTPWTAATSRPGRPARRCAGWSTCCRPVATSTPSTPRPSRPGWPTRPARRWPSRCCTAISTRRAATRSRSACRSGAPRRCGPRATTSPRCWPCSGVLPVWDEASRRVDRAGADPAGRAGPAADRRHGADLRLLPRRLPARGRHARRRRTAGRRAGRAGSSTTSSGRTPQPTLHPHGDQRRATTRIFGSKPGSYGAGILPLIEAGNWRNDADLAEVYTTWGGFAYGRDLDGVPARAGHGGQLPADHRGGQERRHPRARHRRLRRLLPVPRRHGRHRARADRARAEGLRGRLDHAGRRADPLADRGDRPGVPGPGGQPALDRRDATARLQGRVRAGRDRRLPVRLRRDGRRGHRLDVRAAGRRATCWTSRTRTS